MVNWAAQSMGSSIRSLPTSMLCSFLTREVLQTSAHHHQPVPQTGTGRRAQLMGANPSHPYEWQKGSRLTMTLIRLSSGKVSHDCFHHTQDKGPGLFCANHSPEPRDARYNAQCHTTIQGKSEDSRSSRVSVPGLGAFPSSRSPCQQLIPNEAGNAAHSGASFLLQVATVRRAVCRLTTVGIKSEAPALQFLALSLPTLLLPHP